MDEDQDQSPDQPSPPEEAAQNQPSSESAGAPAPDDAGGEAAAGEAGPAGVDGAPDAAPEGSALETLVGADAIRARLNGVLGFIENNMLTLGVAIEAGLLVAALAPAALFGPQLRKFIQSNIAPRAPYGVLRRAASALAHLATPIALYIFLQAAVVALGAFGRSTGLISAGDSLLAAWIVIRLVTLVIRSPFWSRLAFYIVWPIAALDAFGVLDDVLRQLEAFALPIGETDEGVVQTFSALDFLRTLAIFGFLFWGARLLNGLIKGRVNATDELTISFKAMIEKVLDVLLPVVALVLALQIVGFPFGALAIFGGAVGLGIGLGMQRTVSNFFAGFTLLADKSIKPGDIIEIEDTYGWVTEMNSRYVAIRTRDGTSHLVPNDKFIEEGVTNWSHEDRVVRLHAPFGVSYAVKDVRHIARRAEEVCLAVDRVLETPSPRCNLMEFGDNSINYDLRFWINDPANGSSNVRSDVLMAIWDMLAEEGVEIPFPQRDLHLKTVSEDARAAIAAEARPPVAARDG